MPEPRVWQIACGENGRRYDSLFLQHDVAFLGPGRFGPYSAATYEDGLAAQHHTPLKVGCVRQFAKETMPGDFVLARAGYKVVSLGIVAGDYEHLSSLDDVYGWDLNHSRRIVWQNHLDKDLGTVQQSKPLFHGRKQIPMFTRVHDDAILDPIRPFFGTTKTRSLKPLPESPPPPLSLDELASALFERGLSYGAVGNVRDTIVKLRALLAWYSETISPDRPTEHEVIGHVILPLMLALGWSEQLLAVEWRKIDLAVFWGTPTDEEHCQLICEAKGVGSPIEQVINQALGYCEISSPSRPPAPPRPPTRKSTATSKASATARSCTHSTRRKAACRPTSWPAGSPAVARRTLERNGQRERGGAISVRDWFVAGTLMPHGRR